MRIRSLFFLLILVLSLFAPAYGADQRIQYNEYIVGANNPTFADTLNRLTLVEHNNDGTHHWIDVKTYGAKGDGVTDDTAAVQAAITSAPSTGAAILFAPGTYKLTSALSLGNTTGLVLQGAGRTATVLNFTGATNGITMTAFSARVSVLNMTLQGNGTTSLTGFVNTSQSILLMNVTLSGWTTGLSSGQDNIDVLTINTHFNANTTGVSITNTASMPTTHRFFGGQMNSNVIAAKIGSARGISFNGVIFQNNTSKAIELGGTAGQESLAVGIDACWFESNGSFDVDAVRVRALDISGGTMFAGTTVTPVRIHRNDNLGAGVGEAVSVRGVFFNTTAPHPPVIDAGVIGTIWAGNAMGVATLTDNGTATTIINEGRVVNPLIGSGTASTTGFIRLANNAAGIGWRDVGNANDNLLSVDNLNRLALTGNWSATTIGGNLHLNLTVNGTAYTLPLRANTTGYGGNQIIPTASLPAGGAAVDGTILVEDGGAGVKNLIIYGGGQRFRINGGTAF